MRLGPIENTEDVIDSRDVIERIEALEQDTERTEEESAELMKLKELAEEASQYADDWEHGEQLIRASYFREYAEQLADDCCPYPRDSPEHKALQSWPYRHIDWEAAAEELKQDYTSVSFDGVDYWIR